MKSRKKPVMDSSQVRCSHWNGQGGCWKGQYVHSGHTAAAQVQPWVLCTQTIGPELHRGRSVQVTPVDAPWNKGARPDLSRSPARREEKLHQALVAEEGDGVDRERPQAVQQQPLEEDPHPLLSDAQLHAVQDPAVLPAARPRHLQPGFHHVHGCGETPGDHARHATGHQDRKRACGRQSFHQRWKFRVTKHRCFGTVLK